MSNKIKNHLHLNNHKSSQQGVEDFALDVFDAIMKNHNGSFTFSIDDGDGDVWKYTIIVNSEQTRSICQITEN